jgi:hypothetical protein
MADPDGHRGLQNAVKAILDDEAGAEQYRQAQREATSGNRDADGARPLEFDESGFPIPQRRASFVERVARLLNPR